MAIKWNRSKPNELEYTGMDKVVKTVSDTATKVKNFIPNRLKARRQGMAREEIKNIERGFGTVDEYERLYPETAPRNLKLRQEAGYSTSTQTMAKKKPKFI